MTKNSGVEIAAVKIDLYRQAISACEQYMDIIEQFSLFLDNNRSNLHDILESGNGEDDPELLTDNAQSFVEELGKFSDRREVAFGMLKVCADQLMRIREDEKHTHDIESDPDSELKNTSENFCTLMKHIQIIDRKLIEELHKELESVKSDLSRLRGANRTKNAYSRKTLQNPRFIDKTN